jgi:hypothetical protein
MPWMKRRDVEWVLDLGRRVIVSRFIGYLYSVKVQSLGILTGQAETKKAYREDRKEREVFKGFLRKCFEIQVSEDKSLNMRWMLAT